MTTLDRTQAPPFQLSSDFNLPQPEISTLRNGSPLLMFRGLPQEVVRLELILKGGKWDESRHGISHFTSQLLPKGSRNKNAFQTAEAFERLGAHCEVVPGHDFVTVTLYSLTRTFNEASALLIELLHEPAFDENELRLLKDIYIQNLKVNNEKTSYIASKELRIALYGANHPYGHSVEETDVISIDAALIKQHYEKNFFIHAATLVGPLKDSSIDFLTSGIAADAVPKSSIQHHVIIPGEPRQIPMPGSVQTSIRLGKRCVRRTPSPDYFNAVMANHLLGGFFGSRLMKNIREKKGLTYGIYSSMNHFLHDSFWAIGAEVNQQNTSLALDEIRKEIRLLQEFAMPQPELDTARNYFIGSWQSENSTLFAVADKVKSLHLAGLPNDFYAQLLQHLLTITPAQVQEAVIKHFGENDLVEVIAG